MDYFQKIREKIGHDPLFLPAAGIIIYKDGKILLQKRADNGCWAIHGGAMDLGETTEETARRELFEELGLIPTSMELYGVFSGEEMHSFCVNGDEIYLINTIYFCESYTGELKLDPSEVAGIEWFDYDKLPENIAAPVDAAILRGLTQFIEKRYGGRQI